MYAESITPLGVTSNMSGSNIPFKGVRVHRGSLLHCRDPSSFEIVMGINQQVGGRNVKLVLRRNPETSGSVAGSKSVFVSDITPFHESIYSWLNPYRKQDSALLKKEGK